MRVLYGFNGDQEASNGLMIGLVHGFMPVFL